METRLTPNCPYPWQEPLWQRLAMSIKKNTLGHALLFSGPRGLGKLQFAQAFAKNLLCQVTTCQSDCRSCQLITANNHPDLMLISPEEVSVAIKIEQIRELTEKAGQTAQQGRYKIFILAPAHAMTIAASNALLKTLEEPSGKTLIILVTHQSTLLPATIRSRCQLIHFQLPPANMAKQWLKENCAESDAINLALSLAQGAPLYAAELITNGHIQHYQNLLEAFINVSKGFDPIKTVNPILQMDFNQVLDWLLNWTMDLIRLHSGLNANSLIFNDSTKLRETIKRPISLVSLFNFVDQLLQAKQHVFKKLNLNQQLVLENLFCQWQILACNHPN